MKRKGWLEVAEVGGSLGIQSLVICCTVLGRAAARAFLPPLALYYMLFHRTARRASREWLLRVHGRRVTLRLVYGHLLQFARVTLDRLFFVRGQLWRFDLRYHGDAAMQAIRSSATGVLMLGAHLGSFEALRARADFEGVPVNVLGYFRNARKINLALSRLDPRNSARLIEIEPGKLTFIFAVKDRIDQGQHVAVLGDRTGLSGPTVEVEFMGAPARFPAGVYLLAAALQCPVYLLFALYTDPNRYDIHCELFDERVVLPRSDRGTAVTEYAQRYADRLAHYGRLAPDNWFNFFDFWDRDSTGADALSIKRA